MGAVLLLVFLPAMFAGLMMIGTVGGHLSIITVLGVGLFIVLGAALVVGMMRLSRNWDEPHEHPPS